MRADYPAFPTDEFLGIDLRTYLAAIAMQGMLANQYAHQHDIVVESVQYADALIDELNKTEK